MSIDNDDETKVNLSESVINLINLENILDSNSDLALPNVKEEAVKQQSTLLTLKKPSPSNKKKKRKKSKSRSPENRMDPDDEKAESVQRENKVHKRKFQNLSYVNDEMKTDSYDIDQAFDIYNQQAQSRSNLDYNEWKMDDIISWIISLDDGKYKQYENSLKDNFIKHGVNGSHLKYIDKHDLHNWGITDFGHKISIWNQLCELVKDVNNGYGEDEEDEEEEPLTYVLELPREMLTAYILLSLTDKFRDDWNEMGFCGRFGIFLAYALPFGVQIIVTMALMSEVKPEKLRISTGPQDLIFNLCALSILFIYIFYKIVGLIKTTWYFLNKLKREFDKKQEEIERQKISHEEFSLSSPADELRKQLTKSMEELKNIQLKDIDEIGMDQDDRTWIIIYAFRLQIILVLVLYFGLMMYAIVRINSNKHIVDKLEVAISIFFILEVDDWAYILFLGQNMILNDSDFNIEMTAKREGHSKQLKRNTCHLWISLFIVFIGVVGVVLGSNWLYDLLN